VKSFLRIISSFIPKVQSAPFSIFISKSVHEIKSKSIIFFSYFSLSVVIHEEGLCPSSSDINRLMMMMILFIHTYHSCFIPEGVAETSKIFALAMSNTADVTGSKPISPSDRSLSQV
jgi:hypothetical protein